MKIILSSLIFATFWLVSSCNENSSPETPSEISENNSIRDTVVSTDVLQIEEIPVVPEDSIYLISDYKDDKMRYGYKNREGVTIIKKQFDLAGEFYKGVAPVIKGDVHGFIDTTGKIIYKLKKYTFNIFNNELSGENFIEGYDEGLFIVIDENEKIGFVNGKAELVIPCKYDDAKGFSQGRALVLKNDLYGFIDTSGMEVVKPKYELAYSFSDSLACVEIKGKRGFIDLSGKLVIPTIYTQCFYFSEGLCYVTKSENYDNYYYIDKTGKTIIPGPFEQASDFEKGEALIQKRGKCKIIDKTGKVLRSGGESCFEGC